LSRNWHRSLRQDTVGQLGDGHAPVNGQFSDDLAIDLVDLTIIGDVGIIQT
jgi:hypothetical protein